MKRRVFRNFLWVGLVMASVFAAWSWLRPYAWGADPAARCKIVETLVTRDESYTWVNCRLQVIPGMIHDMQKPARLETTDGVMHEPADTTFASTIAQPTSVASGSTSPPADTSFAGTTDQPTTEIWLKFWLGPAEMQGPLVLHLNDGKLSVKASNGIPNLGASNSYNFTSDRW